jgi:hypothetical protein
MSRPWAVSAQMLAVQMVATLAEKMPTPDAIRITPRISWIRPPRRNVELEHPLLCDGALDDVEDADHHQHDAGEAGPADNADAVVRFGNHLMLCVRGFRRASVR